LLYKNILYTFRKSSGEKQSYFATKPNAFGPLKAEGDVLYSSVKANETR